MPTFERDGAVIHFEVEGNAAGFPVLLIAPGGMRSAHELWNAMAWNPRLALADQFRLIGMDQRNAGRSTAPVSATDDWSNFAADQLALLDHLGIDRCHVLGMCIGGPYVIGLLRADPDRFASAVLVQPVGIDGNRAELEAMFDQWAAALAPSHPEATPESWASFRRNMWGGEFVLTATPDEVAAIETPLVVLMGDDLYHPQSTSRTIAAVAPRATLVERWKDDESLPGTTTAIVDFLGSHSS